MFILLGAQELDAVLQMESHESREEGPESPAGRVALDIAQDVVGLLGCKRTLPARVESSIN